MRNINSHHIVLICASSNLLLRNIHIQTHLRGKHPKHFLYLIPKHLLAHHLTHFSTYVTSSKYIVILIYQNILLE